MKRRNYWSKRNQRFYKNWELKSRKNLDRKGHQAEAFQTRREKLIKV